MAACSSFGEDAPGSGAPVGDAGLLETDASTDGAGGARDYASTILADNPLAYWRLGEKPGNFVARDEIGSHDGQYDACTLGVPGAIANDAAASFVPDKSSLAVPVGFDFGGVAAFSIEAWIKPAVSTALYRHAFTQVWNDNGRQGFSLLIDNGSYAVERFVDDNNESKIVAPIAAPVGAFAHVVATYDGAALRLYVDGNTMGKNADTRSLQSKPSPVFIGASGKQQQVVDGVVDEVAVYGTALTEAQVKAHHAAGLAR